MTAHQQAGLKQNGGRSVKKVFNMRLRYNQATIFKFLEGTV